MSRWTLGLSLLAATLLTSCGGGGTPTSVGPFMPDVERVGWQDTKDATHTFNFFDVAHPGQEVSTFDGNEHIGSATHPFAGQYMGRSIQFTIDRPPHGSTAGDVSYSGQFTTNDRIELTSAAGALILCRTGTSGCG